MCERVCERVCENMSLVFLPLNTREKYLKKYITIIPRSRSRNCKFYTSLFE